jgi:ABC-type multidrug transport system ATPase subunit
VTAEPLIRLDRVHKTFGGITAVDSVSLDIAAKTPSGCWARMARARPRRAGDRGPDRPRHAGTVRIDGADPAVPATRRRIGICPQAVAVPQLTGRQNLAFSAACRGIVGS